jgi:hypothetical protein
VKRLIVLLLLFVPGVTQAGSCGFHYGNSYNHKSYHGYSTYHKGSYYWQGGYYGGDNHYSAGYYQPGYYDYHQNYNHYVQPYYIKYKAVIPLVEVPTYGIYVQDSPPERVVPAPASVASSADSKLDRILVLSEKTSKDVDSLRVRVEVLEGKRSPEPVRNTAVKPPEPAVSEEQAVVDLLHKNCFACHESSSVAKYKSKVAFFVDLGEGKSEIAVKKDDKLEPLTPQTLKRIKNAVADKSMPPEKDNSGHPIVMSDDERKRVIAFLDKLIGK